MKELDEKIKKCYENSIRIKELCFKEEKLSYEKGRKLQKLQDEEYNKMMFLNNLRKEIVKKDENEKYNFKF